MYRALQEMSEETITLQAPYQFNKKWDIVRRGTNLKVPYADTWSCYEGGELHCGKCGTCVERKEAFEKAFVIDPTKYA
jgi:7-cyano-7-deazaguanine synthase